MIRLSLALLLLSTLCAAAEQRGEASVYWEDLKVATGHKFNPQSLTAAHRTLPFRTIVRVTHKRRWVYLRIADRGPYRKGRILDLTPAAAAALGKPKMWVGPVVLRTCKVYKMNPPVRVCT